MTWFLPFDIGLVMGLIFAWPVLAFATSFRLFGFPDLTLEGSFPTGAAVFAIATLHGWPIYWAVFAAMAAGAILGALTAFIHLQFRVNKFLSGIIVVAISYTLDLRIMDASNIGLIQRPSIFDFVAPLNDFFGWQFQVGTIGMLITILMCGIFVLLVAINSRWGIRLRVAGSNARYARALGISVPVYLIIGLAITNSLVGGSAAFFAMYQGFADVGMGQGVLILALASMTIGERVVPEQRLPIPAFVFIAAVVGSLLYEILIAYAVHLGLAATDLKLVTAVFVLAVIAIRIRKGDDEFLEVIR